MILPKFCISVFNISSCVNINFFCCYYIRLLFLSFLEVFFVYFLQDFLRRLLREILVHIKNKRKCKDMLYYLCFMYTQISPVSTHPPAWYNQTYIDITIVITQSPQLTFRFALSVVHSVGFNIFTLMPTHHYDIFQNSFTTLKPLSAPLISFSLSLIPDSQGPF